MVDGCWVVDDTLKAFFCGKGKETPKHNTLNRNWLWLCLMVAWHLIFDRKIDHALLHYILAVLCLP